MITKVSKRSFFERLLRKIPCHRARLKRRATLRKSINFFNRRMRKLSTSLRSSSADAARASVWEISSLCMLVSRLEEQLNDS